MASSQATPTTQLQPITSEAATRMMSMDKRREAGIPPPILSQPTPPGEFDQSIGSAGMNSGGGGGNSSGGSGKQFGDGGDRKMLPPAREKKTVRMDVPETEEEKEEKREAAREMAAFASGGSNSSGGSDDQSGVGMKDGLQSPTTPTGGQQVSLDADFERWLGYQYGSNSWMLAVGVGMGYGTPPTPPPHPR